MQTNRAYKLTETENRQASRYAETNRQAGRQTDKEPDRLMNTSLLCLSARFRVRI